MKAGLGFDVSSVSSVETNGAVLPVQLDSVQYVIFCLEQCQKTDLYHPTLLANALVPCIPDLSDSAGLRLFHFAFQGHNGFVVIARD